MAGQGWRKALCKHMMGQTCSQEPAPRTQPCPVRVQVQSMHTDSPCHACMQPCLGRRARVRAPGAVPCWLPLVELLEAGAAVWRHCAPSSQTMMAWPPLCRCAGVAAAQIRMLACTTIPDQAHCPLHGNPSGFSRQPQPQPSPIICLCSGCSLNSCGLQGSAGGGPGAGRCGTCREGCPAVQLRCPLVP